MMRQTQTKGAREMTNGTIVKSTNSRMAVLIFEHIGYTKVYFGSLGAEDGEFRETALYDGAKRYRTKKGLNRAVDNWLQA
jgi:hypothetical protein